MSGNQSALLGAGIKSIQRGKITLAGAASVTATISAVVVSKTELRYLGNIASNTDSYGDVMIELTNSTTITATKTSGPNTSITSWELTEFY